MSEKETRPSTGESGDDIDGKKKRRVCTYNTRYNKEWEKELPILPANGNQSSCFLLRSM